MSIIDCYLNEKVVWEKAFRHKDGSVRKDGSGRTMYRRPKNINAYLVDVFGFIRDRNGKEIVCSGRAIVKADVQLDDLINGRVVEKVAKSKDLMGDKEGITAFLR